MPYRHAPWFVGLVLLVILAGFWGTYWSPIRHVPVAFHVHAVSASAWLLLLIAQSVAIRRRALWLHRQLGQLSFVMFPALIVGFTMIIDVAARKYVAATDPFAVTLGPAFGVGMVVAIAAYLTLFHQAMRHRHSVRLHAGYLLATPLILFESPFSRILDHFPAANVIGHGGPLAVIDTIVISDGLAALFALGLYAADRRHGTPWLVAAGFIALQAAAMASAPHLPALGAAFAAYATLPLGAMAAVGAALGGLAGWTGWVAGSGHGGRGVVASAGARR